MKRKKQNKAKLKNLGFSLIEVLLAIVILGLVAAPILQIFLTSAKINNRSREVMAATDVANLTMEYLTSMDFDNDIKPLLTENTSTERFPALSYTATATDMGTSHGTLADFESNIVANYTADSKQIFYNSIMGDSCLGVAVKDIEYNGFTFDMIIWFESNKEGSDEYYTYDVVLEVFKAQDAIVEDDEGNKSEVFSHFNEKIITVDGAVANK